MRHKIYTCRNNSIFAFPKSHLSTIIEIGGAREGGREGGEGEREGERGGRRSREGERESVDKEFSSSAQNCPSCNL